MINTYFVEGFYRKGSNAVDMNKDKATSNFKTWDSKQYISLARKNTVYFLCKTSSEFFYLYGEDVCLNEELGSYFTNKKFVNHVSDAIEFRTKEYYKNRFENK